MNNDLDSVRLQKAELQELSSQFMEGIRENSGWTIGIGVLLVILGVLALASPMLTGISVSIMVGILVAMGGIAQLIFAAKAGQGIWPYATAILSICAGIYMASHPIVAVGTLTVILAFFLFALGVTEVMMAWQVKPAKGWIMTLITGILSLALGVMIWGEFPVAGALAIGVLLGVKLLFSGFMLISLGSAAKKTLRNDARQ